MASGAETIEAARSRARGREWLAAAGRQLLAWRRLPLAHAKPATVAAADRNS
eukprot:COSAG06_NODE_54850_length_292_cov_1.134715_1_plen_51_part_01